MTQRHGAYALVLLAAMSAPVAAQTPQPENAWSYGTTIDLQVGAATASSRSGLLLGGGVGWEVTPWFGIEGSLAWMDLPGNAEAFSADLTAEVSLLPSAKLVPFVKGGIGLHRAYFDGALDEIPEFYRRRLGSDQGVPRLARTFTDPSFLAGGGAQFFLTRQWALEPEIVATMVRRSSETHLVTTVVMRVAYHFEDHPITPSRQESSR